MLASGFATAMIQVLFQSTYNHKCPCDVQGAVYAAGPPHTYRSEGQERGGLAGTGPGLLSLSGDYWAFELLGWWEGGKGEVGACLLFPQGWPNVTIQDFFLNILLKKKKKKMPGLQFCLYGLSHEISFYLKSKTPAQRVRKLANLLRMAVWHRLSLNCLCNSQHYQENVF